MPRSRVAVCLLVAAIVAVALNQRPAVVAVAPVLGDLRADTGLSSALAGLLTTLPVLCFGAFAPVAPRLARRSGKLPESNLDFVVARKEIKFAAFDGGANVAVRGWPDEPTPQKRLKWVKEMSDHALLYFEVHD